MRDFLEVIAQQIDKIAAKPLEAAGVLAGLYVFYSWLGWWGVIGFIGLLLLVTFLVDVFIYFMCSRQTYAKYGDSVVWLSGFHPLRARSIARTCDQAIKKHGERAFLNEIHRLALEHGSEITVTATDAEGNTRTSSTLPLEDA